MSRSFLGFSLIVVVFTGVAAAQQEQQPMVPKPGAEHARLKKIEGTWDAVMTSADGKKSKSVAVYKMECGGLWLTSDFRGEFEGAPFQGKGLDGYDQIKKKYVGVWVDNMITTPLFMEGTLDESTKTMTMTGEAPGPDGKPMKLKAVTKHPDDDHMTFDMFMQGPDSKESKAFTIEYTRRK